jgi:hypothetical protein
MAQEPCRGEHHQANPENEDQMDEINMIFRGRLSISSKTQGKKLEREISMAQRIEPGRKNEVVQCGYFLQTRGSSRDRTV